MTCGGIGPFAGQHTENTFYLSSGVKGLKKHMHHLQFSPDLNTLCVLVLARPSGVDPISGSSFPQSFVVRGDTSYIN